MNPLLRGLGARLAAYLSQENPEQKSSCTSSGMALKRCLKKGDVLLIEGSSRISVAIKYLTQSTWSHAALYVGDTLHDQHPGGHLELIEADLNEGVRAVSLAGYEDEHTRICRPVGLSDEDIDRVVGFAIDRIGTEYDLKNVFDLARYLIATPPVPSSWRRSMIALGSGDPTRAICSSLIAQAFQSVKYPILPNFICQSDTREGRGLLQVRHHSLYVPRDFDISPYFRIVKPTIEQAFDPYSLKWEA